jgi:hypothetical protein
MNDTRECHRCNHPKSDHETDDGPCDIKNDDGTHCICYAYLSDEYVAEWLAEWHAWRDANMPGGE